MIERLGRRFARVVTNLVVRFPQLWPLFRPLMRRQFGQLAPIWDRDRSPDAFASLEAALATVDGPVRTVLDLGTGTGSAAFVVEERFPDADILGIDIAPEMIEQARRKSRPDSRVRFRVADAADLGEADGAYDLVTAANMIPFFDELARLVAPRGYLVLSFSIGPETPIYVPPERLRSQLEPRGFADFAEFAAGRGTAFLARKR